MTHTEYKEQIEVTATPEVDKILDILKRCEEDLFCGKEEIQPLKIYQLQRIYRLAKNFIEFLVVIYPYIKLVLPYIMRVVKR
jgi:hypothetical protein